MEKIFKNKGFAYTIIGILMALEITLSVASWCSGDFNVAAIVMFVLLMGMLALCAVGICKENKKLIGATIISMISVLIYVMTSETSGIVIQWWHKQIPDAGLAAGILFGIANGLFIGCLILMILSLFGIKKHLRTLNTVFSLVSVVFILTSVIISLVNVVGDSSIDPLAKLFWSSGDFFGVFFALLITSVGYQLSDLKPAANK